MLFIRNKGADKTDTPIEWNTVKEKQFQSKKTRALSLFKDITNSASCNDVGLSTIIQGIVYKNRAGELRENIIQSYFDGQLLSEKEVQFLALTSQELNKFIDKELYQKYVDLLSPEFVNQLEINITEQILDDYYKAREVVSNKRERYLEEKNESTKKKIEKNTLDFFDRSSKPGLSFQRYQQKSVKKQIMKQLAAKSHVSVADSRSRASSSKQTDPAADKPSATKHKASRSFQAPRVYSDFQAKHKVSHSGLFGEVPDAAYYRMRHPTSKIIPLTTANNRTSFNNIEELEREQRDKRVLSNQTKPPGYRTNFYYAYSAGPQGIKRLEKRRKIISKNKAALLIQKAWKGYIARKNLWANEALASVPTQPRSQTQTKPREALKRPDSNSKKLLRRVTFQNKEKDPEQRELKDDRHSNRTGTDSLPSMENVSNNLQRKSSRKNSSRIEETLVAAPSTSPSPQMDVVESLALQQQREFHAHVSSGNLARLAVLDHKQLRKFINSPSEDGSYPIESAVQSNNVELAAFIIENGLNLKKCSLDAETLFDSATACKSFKVRSADLGQEIPCRCLPTETESREA